MEETLSVSEYARYRDIAESTLREAISNGKISYELDESNIKRINVAKADEEWAANTERMRGSVLTVAQRDQPSLFPELDKENKDRRTFKATDRNPDFTNAKTLKEEALAKMAVLEFKQRSSELINRAFVKKLISEKNSSVIKNLHTMRIRIAGILAQESDQFKIDRLLEQEINNAVMGLDEYNDL